MKYIFTFLLLLTVNTILNAQLSPVGSYDSCGAAINLTVNATCITGSQTYTTAGSSKSPQPSTGISNDDDVWFKFTTVEGQTHAKIEMKNMVGSMGACFELWSTCNATAAIGDGCGAEYNVSGLTPLTTYLLRVYSNGTFSTITSFQLCVSNTTPPPPAPNNNCSFATAIQVSSSFSSCNPFPITNQYTIGSTAIAPPACVSGGFRDVWVKFTPSSNENTELSIALQNYTAITGSTFPSYYIAVYTGTNCSELTLRGCSFYSAAQGKDQVLPGTYLANITYYVRILCSSDTEGRFNVCVKPAATTTSFPTAADSTCTKAITINTSVDNSAAYTQGTTNGIRRISQLACYGSNAPNALAWYKFTVPSNGLYLVDFSDLISLDGNAVGVGYRLLKANNCYTTGTDTIITSPPPGSYDTVACIMSVAFANQTVNLTSGTQYYLTVMENSYNGGRAAYKVRVIGTTPPVNDEMTNAVALVQDVACNGGTPTSIRFSTLSSVPSTDAITNGPFRQDVWYKFTAATTSANINVTLSSGPTRLVVYNNNGTILYDPGSNASIITVNGLTIGNQYFIRVLNASGMPVGPNADFRICVFGVANAIAGTTANCTTADAVQVSTNSGRWLHFTKAGNIVLSVFDGPATPGANFIPRGNITANYFTNTGGMRFNAGIAYLDRNFEISDGGNNFTNSPVRVRFYFTVQEFNNLISAPSNRGISAPYELKVYRIPGANCSNSTTAGGLYYRTANYGFLTGSGGASTPIGYYVDLITPNFSGFFLQDVAENVIVPATCGSFTYKSNATNITFSLHTLTENNVQQFELQQSSDGSNFSTIQIIAAQNQQNSQYNTSVNWQQISNKAFFRIKQLDKDGSISYLCNTLQINKANAKNLFAAIYPNPVSKQLVLQTKTNFSGLVTINLYQSNGNLIKQLRSYLTAAQNNITIPVASLANGNYYLQITTNHGSETQRFIKQ